jgi:hypothetical protein
MDFAPTIASPLREMDPRIFRDEPMGSNRGDIEDDYARGRCPKKVPWVNRVMPGLPLNGVLTATPI